MKNFTYKTSIGDLTISEESDHIYKILFGSIQIGIKEETPLIKEAYHQICEYFAGKRRTFNLPLKFEGTKFQIQVWKALLEIPYGQTASYKDIAIKINHSNAYRAVGNANNKNPIPIIIPCHRVISASGDIGGFSGNINIKKFLLNIEKNNL